MFESNVIWKARDRVLRQVWIFQDDKIAHIFQLIGMKKEIKQRHQGKTIEQDTLNKTHC